VYAVAFGISGIFDDNSQITGPAADDTLAQSQLPID
jgi:hypothetical protein